MAHTVDYVVAMDWGQDGVTPKRLVLMDTLTCEQMTVVSVGDTWVQSEHEWHVPALYFPSFCTSSYFKMLCLPIASEDRELILGTNDPMVWNFFLDRQVAVQWLDKVAHRPELPLVVRVLQLANHIKEAKMIEWTCEYLEQQKRWKRVGRRLESK